MKLVFKSSYLWLTGLCLVFAVVLYWIDPHGLDTKERQSKTTVLYQYRDYNSEYFAPIPLGHTQDERKVALGKLLFVDPRLSGDNSTACVSCHSFTLGGADARRVSIGVAGRKGVLNAPTVYNVGFNIAQFWDGRAATLEEQVAGPIHESHEMDSNWIEVIAKLSDDHSLRKQFNAIYPDGITQNNIIDALVSFERALITPGSAFDRYLSGDTQALEAKAEEGMQRFIEFGCVSCHQGVNLGGNMYQRFGVFEEFDKAIVMSNHWQGRYAVTGREEDRGVFKVPGLRNVALTAPYFHDGSAETLEEAVQLMGRNQLGRQLSEQDVGYLVAFLETLTGNLPEVLSE